MNKIVEYLKNEDIKSYIEYIKDVFDYEIEESTVKKIIKNNKVLIIKNQDKIIASAMLEERFEYIKSQKYYWVGYFGVLKEYRRKGYANIIFEEIEKLIQENDINYLEIVSGNQRKAAHYFYHSKGFKIKDATIFVKLY